MKIVTLEKANALEDCKHVILPVFPTRTLQIVDKHWNVNFHRSTCVGSLLVPLDT